MNDSSIVNMQTLNRDAALNVLIYLGDYYQGVEDGTSVSDIVWQAEQNLNAKIKRYEKAGHTKAEVEEKYGDKLRKLTVLQNAVAKDSDLGSLVIANQSCNMLDQRTGLPYEENGIVACTFQDSLNNPTTVSVVFRGTALGEWYDNGLGLSGETVGTDQQLQAVEYFDYIVGKNNWEMSRPEINVSGHSKGGNKAQYTVMMSKYSDLITDGYSLDGQCMSEETISYMKNVLGEEEYEKRRQKLFSFAADNDYINVLGTNFQDGRLIPDDHIFFLESNLSGTKWHNPDCYMNVDGTVTSFTEQGEYSQILEGASKALMDLPAPLRGVITRGAMGIAQKTLGKNKAPVNGEILSYADIVSTVDLVIGLLPAGFINYLGDQFGVNLEWLANVVTGISLILMASSHLVHYGIGKFIDYSILAIEKIKQFGEKCEELTTKIVSIIGDSVKKLQKWYKKYFDAGFRYATENPQIVVDTYKLTDYSNRLNMINKRISALDRRMNSLYGRVGLKDLWNLLQADVLTGYSWRLVRCATYLKSTSSDFEKAERKIAEVL